MAYRGSEAYDFSLFEPQVATTRAGSAAPAKKSAPAVKQAPKKQVKNAPQKKQNTSKYVQDDARTATKNELLPSGIIKVMAVAAVMCAMWMGLLVMQAQCETISSRIADLNEKIDIADGEYVRLTAELNSKMSSEKIEDYAVNKLGMVKAESYQIDYIDLSEGDKVVVSGSKGVNDGGFALKVKEMFAYIF